MSDTGRPRGHPHARIPLAFCQSSSQGPLEAVARRCAAEAPNAKDSNNSSARQPNSTLADSGPESACSAIASDMKDAASQLGVSSPRRMPASCHRLISAAKPIGSAPVFSTGAVPMRNWYLSPNSVMAVHNFLNWRSSAGSAAISATMCRPSAVARSVRHPISASRVGKWRYKVARCTPTPAATVAMDASGSPRRTSMARPNTRSLTRRASALRGAVSLTT